jgi:hypothetical protein
MSLFEQEVMADAPYQWWKLNEGAGATQALDSSGNGRHSSVSGSPPTMGTTAYVLPNRPTDAVAKLDKASGTVQSFQDPRAVTPGVLINNFTFEIWCRPTATITHQQENGSGTFLVEAGEVNRFVAYPVHGGSSNGGCGLSVGTNSVNSHEHGNSYAVALATFAMTISNDRLHQIVLRVDAKRHRLWVDGVLRRSGLTSSKTNVIAPAYVGDQGTSLQGQPFGGEIAHAIWYSSVLSSDRILAHYNAGITLPNIWVDAGSKSPMVMG